MPVQTLMFVIIAQVPTFAALDITLEEIPNLIEQQNLDVKVAESEVSVAESETRLAYGRMLPQISLKGSYVRLPEELTLQIPSHTATGNLVTITIDPPPILIQTEDLMTSRLQAMQPLYTGGRISAGIQSANAKKSEAEARWRLARAERTVEAMTRYMQRQLATQVSQVLAEVVSNLERLVAVAESLVRHGAAAKLASLQIRVAKAEAESKLTEARGKANLADLAFKNSISMAGQDIKYESPLVKMPMNLPANSVLTAAALKNRDEFKIIAAKHEQVDALKTASIGEALPTVFAFGAVQVASSRQPVLEPKWAVGVGIDIPLSGWVSALEERKKAAALAAKVQLLARKANEEIPLQVEKLLSEIRSLDANFRVIDESANLAKEALRVAEIRFKSGDNSSVELIRSQSEYERVLIQRMQLTEEFNRKLLEVYSATGNLSSFIKQYRQVRK